jgi:hypothetical protein
MSYRPMTYGMTRPTAIPGISSVFDGLRYNPCGTRAGPRMRGSWEGRSPRTLGRTGTESGSNGGNAAWDQRVISSGRMHVRPSVGCRENRLTHGPLRGGLAAPEHGHEPVVLQPARTLRRAATGAEVVGPEAEGELIIVAVGPSAHEIIGYHEADFEIPRHVDQPGRDFCGNSGSDAIGVPLGMRRHARWGSRRGA